MSCLRTTFLRAIRTILLSATLALAALTLTACGGSSESKAKDTAVELMTAMYENDLSVLMEHLPIPNDRALTPTEEESVKTKLGQMTSVLHIASTERGGIEKFEAIDYRERKNGEVVVKMRTHFGDGTTNDSKVELIWDEAKGNKPSQRPHSLRPDRGGYAAPRAPRTCS